MTILGSKALLSRMFVLGATSLAGVMGFSIVSAMAEPGAQVRIETTTDRVWEGKIVTETDRDIVIRGVGGTFTIPRAAIRHMEHVQAKEPVAPIATNRPAAAGEAWSSHISAEQRAGVIRLTGSNTIGSQLGPDLLIAYGRDGRLIAPRDEPGALPEERTLTMHAAESDRTLRAEIQAHGTATSFTDLLAGKADVGMASRRITEAEVKALAASGAGNLLQPGNENVISLDGVAVVVHRDNPVRALSRAQLKDILTGAKTRWSAFGGPDIKITAYSPDEKTGAFDLLQDKILGKGVTPPPDVQRFESNEDLADAVASNPGGIGFVSLADTRNTKTIPLATECGVPPSEPSVFQVKTDEYPLARRLYLYLGDNRSPLAEDFVAYTLSAAAQPVIEHSGFVNLDPMLAPASVTDSRLNFVTAKPAGPATARAGAAQIKAFGETVRGARRLSVTVRFETGKTEPDTRSKRDLERLRDWTQQPGRARSLTLMGHSSIDGDYNANVALSLRRAHEVEQRLKGLGVQVAGSIGVGPISPVVCERGPDDANINRRVEIWVQ